MKSPIAPCNGAVLAAASEAMCGATLSPLAPAADPRIAKDWTIIGYFIGADALLSTQKIGLGERVYYGFLAKSVADPLSFAAVVRGTEAPIEWLEDAECILVPSDHGMVEQGFSSIYQSLRYYSCDATQTVGYSARQGIEKEIPPNASVTFIGHSLGSAIVTYLMTDVAADNTLNTGVNVCGLLFASPKPGDATYSLYVDRTVGHDNYVVYNYIRDVVPRLPISLPFGLGFQALPNVTVLKPSDSHTPIPDNIGSNHAAMNYATLLGYAAATTTVGVSP